MIWYQIFQDSPEFEARKTKGVFTPPNISMKDVRDAVPKHLFKRSTAKSLTYLLRHLAFISIFYYCATQIDAVSQVILPRSTADASLISHTALLLTKGSLWMLYGGWQGMTFAGLWCLGHEAGHHALSEYVWINTAIGMVLHTFVLTPYHAWRVTHQMHHKATNDLGRDETYIPVTRKDLQLPDGKVAVPMDHTEILGETPAFTFIKLFIRQFFGFQLYLIHNRKGNPKYPSGTSHYKPSSLLFKPRHRYSIILSNIAICAMILLLLTYIYQRGWSSAWCYYFFPWLMAHNWIVMVTYLQHSDPTIPYYRKDQWTFTRGILATVDRPLFGWAGRLFLYNISSDHVAHHFFPAIPFYNVPQVTEAIKPVLGDYYNYDSTPVLYALWRSFTQCVFVEDEGDILFFKNQFGESIIQPKTS